MKFERLFIEKQLKEREKREREKKNEIEDLQKQIEEYRYKRKNLENMNVYEEVIADLKPQQDH